MDLREEQSIPILELKCFFWPEEHLHNIKQHPNL
jgi:hypothetical protein